jgi:hypothetical protein
MASRHFVAIEGDKIFKAILSLSLWTLSPKASGSSDLMVMTPLMMLSLRSFQTQSFSH